MYLNGIWAIDPFLGPVIILVQDYPWLEYYDWKNVCKQLKLTKYRKWMVDYKITYVVDNVSVIYHCKSCL